MEAIVFFLFSAQAKKTLNTVCSVVLHLQGPKNALSLK